MAVRTSYAAVALLIDVDSTISTDLAPFIEVANSLVTDVCTNYDTPYTDAKLELIERWLSAHFYAVRESRASEQRAVSVSRILQSKVDLGLDVTHYGQQAKLIDTEGGLAALDGRLKSGKAKVTPGISWLGVDDWDIDNI